ncbi:MAG: hypothetical protein DSM106950_36765 [Stigonema ocellatum SAG 48.90 = DSM 106950]|nr:hypothetical protein [Stigonema ocellatum SAG 48.90 = DSM 106950]
MKGKKIFLCLSVAAVSASAIGFFTRPATVQAGESVTRPTIATVKKMSNGDLMCYVTLVDAKRKVYEGLGASFEICEKEKTYLNKKVRLSYQKGRVNDCQSAEPCGKTRIETLITKMQIIR